MLSKIGTAGVLKRDADDYNSSMILQDRLDPMSYHNTPKNTPKPKQ